MRKAILTPLLFWSSFLIGCPVRAVHDSVQVLIRQKVVEIRGNQMFIRRDVVVKLANFLKASDKNAVEKFLKNLESGFEMYAHSHGLELMPDPPEEKK